MSEVELQRQINHLQDRIAELERQEYAMANTYGWIGAVWQKNPILDGYSGVVSEQKSNLSASAGANTLTSTAVPAGEIWRVQAVEAFDNTTAPGYVLIYVTFSGGTANTLIYSAAPAAGGRVYWTGEITLSAGDTINALFSGCTLNDDIYMQYHAVRVDIDQ